MKTTFKKIKIKIKKFFKKFWQNLTLLFLLILILDLVFVGFLFFKYYFKKEEKSFFFSELKINQNIFQKLSLEWEKRIKIYEQIPKNKYSDPFLKINLK